MTCHLIPQMIVLVMNSTNTVFITATLKGLFIAPSEVQEAANIRSIFLFLKKVLAISRFWSLSFQLWTFIKTVLSLTQL